MNITFKLYATLSPYLPDNAIKNEVPLKLEPGTSAKQVIDRFSLPIEKCHLILVNGLYTPLMAADQKILQEGDVLAIWPPVAGG